MAAHITTYLRFDAPIDSASVEVAERTARFRLVDPGEQILALEPAMDLGAGEKLHVRVRYKDGGSPVYVTFALVSHPSLVDKEVEVVRPMAAPCETSGPAGLVLSGQLDKAGVRTMGFRGKAAPGNESGLSTANGMSYWATLWVVATVYVTNLPGQKPWVPGSARLFSAEGTPVRMRRVQLQGKSQLQPGESGIVGMEMDPPISIEGPFRLELVDVEGGRLHTLHEVNFH